MEYIIWYSKEEKEYKLEQQIEGSVFYDKTQYMRILYRFKPDQLEEAQRIVTKLNDEAKSFL